MADLSVNIKDLKLKNPVMTASGTFGYGLEFADFVPLEEIGADSPTSPSLFGQPQTHGVKRTPKNIANAAVKYVDKPQRKITEIRIFYDDQTWETFVPKK
jgi:hypothetical protein